MPLVNAVQALWGWGCNTVAGAGTWLWNDTLVASWQYIAPHMQLLK